MKILSDRLPESKKDRAWRIGKLKYWSEMKMDTFMRTSDYKLLEIASGRMLETDYTFITNPYNLKDSKYHKYPAKLRNLDIISPIFLRWLSEYNERPFEPIVYTKNSNFDNEKLAFEKNLIDQSLQQRFINALMRTGAFDPNQTDELGNPVQPPMSEEVIKQKTSSLPDLKTITGQHAINYIVDKQELKTLYRRGYEYFIKINRCVTFKDVRQDEVVVQLISPLDVKYYGNRNVTYLEDAEAITVDYYLTYEEVLEIFQETFEEYKSEYGDLAAILERRSEIGSNGMRDRGFFHEYMRNRHGVDTNADISEDKRIQVRHVQFTSFRLVKQVMDENGELLNLTEDYQGNDVVNELWFPEEREGWIIANRYFIGGYACEIQRVDADNPYSTKKNYNGLIFLKGDVEQLTIPEKLAQYQEAYNATGFKLQSAINKDLGNVLGLPVSLMKGLKETKPMGNIHYKDDINKLGKPAYEMQVGESSNDSVFSKMMYFMNSSGVLPLDDSAENFNVAVQAFKSVNMGQAQFIQWLDQRMNIIAAQARDLVGFNDARTGNIKTSENVGNAQQNAYSGSLVTEEYYTEFEEFIARDLQGALDLSKYAFRVGKKAHYVRSNTDVQVLTIDEGFAESSYGIFVRSGAKSKSLKDVMIGQATQIMQNAPKGMSTLGNLITSSANYSEIIQEIAAKEEEFAQMEQQAKQADRDNQLQIAQIAAEDKAEDRELEYYKVEKNAEIAIAKAGITALSFNGGEGQEDNALAIASKTNELMTMLNTNATKRKEMETKERIADKQNASREKIAKTQFAIAKENKP